MNLNNNFALTLGLTSILLGCSGGSSSSATPVVTTPAATTFEYDRIAATHTNKAWDSIIIGKFINDQQEFVVDYAPSTTRAVVETTTSMQIDFTGTTTVSYTHLTLPTTPYV